MESAYASTFLTSLAPQQAAAVLRDRVASNKSITDDLAEWFKEFQIIEQTYGRSLGKLASRLPTTDIANLGVMEKPWRRTIDNLNSLATHHAKFATKMTSDVIGPLTQFQRTPENGNMSMLERNLSQIARDMESAESRSAKSGQSKSKNKSSKQSDANEDLRTARGRWDSEAPNTFERLQQVDEARVVFLKDTLVKFETSTIDLCTTQIKSSENAIAQLLEINPTDEPMDFVTKKFAQGEPRSVRAAGPAPGLSRTLSQGDSNSIRSSNGPATSLKSKFGTLLKGRSSGSPGKRSSIMQRKPSSSAMARQNLPEMREEPEPVRPVTQADPVSSTDSRLLQHETATTAINASPFATGPSSSTTVFATHSSPAMEPTSSREAISDINAERPRTHYSSPAPHNHEPVTNLQNSFRGVSIRSDSYGNNNTNEDDAAMDKVASTLRAQPTISRRSRGRRDVRTSVFSPLQEGETSTVARDVLGSPMPQTTEPIFMTELASSIPMAQTTPASIAETSFANRGSLINRQNTASAMSYDGSESIRSTRSNPSASYNTKHVEPTTDGLHLSVIETVNVLVGIEGSLSRFTVTGEAAIANRNARDSLPLQLQIQSPDTLERLVADTHILRNTGQNTYELPATSAPHITTLFKYQVQPTFSRQARFMPILLTQKWSPEENQTSVKLTYRLNPLFGAGSLSLRDVEVSVSVNGLANSCVAKPAGTFVKRASRLVWRLNELTLESGVEGVLLARFKTNSLCPPSDVTELKFKTVSSNIARGSGFGIYATRIKDNPFVDSPTIENVIVQSAYVLQSGSFAASTSAP